MVFLQDQGRKQKTGVKATSCLPVVQGQKGQQTQQPFLPVQITLPSLSFTSQHISGGRTESLNPFPFPLSSQDFFQSTKLLSSCDLSILLEDLPAVKHLLGV